MHTTVHWDLPYVTIDYGDRYIDSQELLTCAVACDLLADLGIYTAQPTHNTLVFERPRDYVLALVYMTKYEHFSFRGVDPLNT